MNDIASALPDLSGKSALVTGASRGIGYAVALLLASAGAHVYALGRTTGALEELDDEIRAAGGSATLIPFDLVEGDGIEQMAGSLASRDKKLDILVLNAASLGELAPLPDIDPKIWQKTLNLNITANWRLLRALDPLLQNADAAKVIFMTSRVGGERARAFWGVYAVTKAAGEMLMKTYAAENENSALTVSIIDPGAMRTHMRAQAMPGEDPEVLPRPAEIAPALRDALTSRETLSPFTLRDSK